jgi:hypothetical protein
LEGDEVASRIHDRNVQFPIMLFGFIDGRGNGRFSP